MKTLRVSLADLEGQPHGSHHANTNVTVTARYTSDLVLADGTIVPAAIKTKTLPASGSVDFEVYASNSPDVAPVSQGAAIVATARGKSARTGGASWTVTRTVKVLMNSPAELGALAEATPTPQYDAGVVKTVNGVAPDASGNVDSATATVAVASTTVAGRVELATAAETATGTDAVRAVTPAGVKPLLDAKANAADVYTKAEVDTAVAGGGGGATISTDDFTGVI